jgi:hypothetical protein
MTADAETVFARRRRYWANGYRPLEVWNPDQRVNDKGDPLKSPGKQPRGKWREQANRNPPAATETFPDARALNTGVLCGEVVAFDVDVSIQELADQIVHLIEDNLGPTPLVRVGMAPRILLVYRPESRFSKVQTPELVLPNIIKVRVELLAEGQQFVADGTHPNTGQPYTWTGGSPEDVPIAELPVIAEAQARDVINEAERLLRTVGAREKEKPRREYKPSSSGGSFFGQVNTAALANIEAWAPTLFHQARFQPGTGAWRVSSEDLGRDLDEDISIHPGGIWDFGEEAPLTAVDLVIRCASVGTALEAALWLCGKLRIKPSTLGFTGAQQHGNLNGPVPNGQHDHLQIQDAGDIDVIQIPPRGWLLGVTFCRKFLSGLISEGGGGKTAIRYVQYLATATGRTLTGEHVHHRCRVLIVCLEDNLDEVRRRIGAAMLHHGITSADVKGWLFYCTPKGLKLLEIDPQGARVIGGLYSELRTTIAGLNIDIVGIDPFVKSHGVEENDNNAIDQVCIILADIADEFDCAVDIVSHARKGPPTPGDADRERGASSKKDAGRLMRTVTGMTEAEAALYDVANTDRPALIRVDDAKVNLTPRSAEAMWFKLVGVPLGNTFDPRYPKGDNVQTVGRWTPPDIWKNITISIGNKILDRIDQGPEPGRRYSPAPQAKDRAAWLVVHEFCAELNAVQCKKVIAKWLNTGVLKAQEYVDPKDRHTRQGLFVAQRPGNSWDV